MSLPWIFDRRRSSHRWLKAFGELAQGDDVTRRAVVENWRMDPRMSEDREDEMLAAPEFAGQPGGEEWWAQRGKHYHRALRLDSAHLAPSNAGNRVPRGTVPPHEQLIHVASLNRTLWHLTSAELLTPDLEMGFPNLAGRSLPHRPVGSGFREREVFHREVDEIAAEINRRGLDTVKALARLVCGAFGDAESPWWAGFAQELMPLVEDRDWSGLCRALGVGHYEPGEWLLVFRYEIGVLYLLGGDVELYRPTVVEADDNPLHFPSPPGHRYGITMPLDAGQRAAYREVIHESLAGQAAADACAYELCQIADSPLVDHNRLDELRRAHRRRLENEPPSADTSAWLGRHPHSL